MGRHKVEYSSKKVTISITLDEEVLQDLQNLQIKSKSKLIDRLLKDHFNAMNYFKK